MGPSWKAETTAPSTQKGSGLNSSVNPDWRKMVGWLLKGDIWEKEVKALEERRVRRGDLKAMGSKLTFTHGVFMSDSQRAFLTAGFNPTRRVLSQLSIASKNGSSLISRSILMLRPSDFFWKFHDIHTSLLMPKLPGICFEGEAGKPKSAKSEEEWQSREEVRQRNLNSVSPSLEITPCLVSLHQRVASPFTSQFGYHLHRLEFRPSSHDSHPTSEFRTHSGPGFHTDPA